MSRAVLDDARIERYCRQILLPEVGPAGQRRLLESLVTVRTDRASLAATTVLLRYLIAGGVGEVTLEGDGAPDLDPIALEGTNPDARVRCATGTAPRLRIHLEDVGEASIVRITTTEAVEVRGSGAPGATSPSAFLTGATTALVALRHLLELGPRRTLVLGGPEGIRTEDSPA